MQTEIIECGNLHASKATEFPLFSTLETVLSGSFPFFLGKTKPPVHGHGRPESKYDWNESRSAKMHTLLLSDNRTAMIVRSSENAKEAVYLPDDSLSLFFESGFSDCFPGPLFLLLFFPFSL